MAFDVLRTYHVVDAKIDERGTITKRIKWKPCKPGAKAFPGWHSYGSPVWEPHPEDWTSGPGIETGPLTYHNGKGYVPPGQEFHGPKEWFETGIPSSEIAALTHDSPTGTCWPPVEAIESQGKVVEKIENLCACDITDIETITITTSDKTGRYSLLPDTIVLTTTDEGCVKDFYSEEFTDGVNTLRLSMNVFASSTPLILSFGVNANFGGFYPQWQWTDEGGWSVLGIFYGDITVAHIGFGCSRPEIGSMGVFFSDEGDSVRFHYGG